MKFTFETPPPKLVSSFPPAEVPQFLDAPIFVRFDQKIDPAAVLAKLQVLAGGKPWGVQPIPPGELELLVKSRRADHRQIAALVLAAKKDSHDGRWLALRPSRPFPVDASIEVVILEGTPSAEGPNRTREAQRFAFRTYPKLRVEKAECGGECPPGQMFGIDFNNPLDSAKIDRKLVTVTPDVPGLRVFASGDHLFVAGQTTARTRYKVTISRGLTDEFGQELGQDETVTWLVGDAYPSFFGPSGVVVLDPAAQKPALDFFSINYTALKVRLYKVSPSDFGAYRAYLRDPGADGRAAKPPGALVRDELVQTRSGSNQLAETSVELAPVLGRLRPRPTRSPSSSRTRGRRATTRPGW